MRVLFISQYFPPETGAAPARALHFARSLAALGHEVTVVTGLPNHPSGVIRPEFRGTRRKSETLDGIRIERVWLYATPRKNAWTRLWNHLSFACAALPAALGASRPDVVLATTPPLFHGITAWLVSRLRRAPLVLDVRDDWPHAAIALGEMRDGFVARVLAAISRFLQVRAHRVVVVTPGMRVRIEDRGIEDARLTLITNGADTELFRPAAESSNGEPSAMEAARFTVLYAGTHGLVHGMEALMDAAERLKDRSEIRFLLVGDGVAKAELERRAREQQLQHVEFRPSEPPERLVETIRAADVCVATTRAGQFYGETIPVKLFDYLACGRPVVAAVTGDAADVVERSGGGVVVEPGNGGALAEALVELAGKPERRRELGRAGPPFVEANYSRHAAGARLETVLREVERAAHGRDVPNRPAGLYAMVRRLLDIMIAGGALLVLSPVFAIIALAIRFDSPGPVLFRQRRSGRRSSEFTILKFRTMKVGTPDLASHLMGPGSSRVTRLGGFLRRTSLDELPQLWNVLKGDMTIVGPRPALYNQYDLIGMRQAVSVDALKPGITGWAQVNGRDDIPMERKVELDRTYLEHLTPGFDLFILFRTVVVLFSRRGVY
jgi:lipopolysaccharide/colanic/teichoic acid biosynthesis glycosyltransferase/glycosyltransferase involved in cell wall biosynthesis